MPGQHLFVHEDMHSHQPFEGGDLQQLGLGLGLGLGAGDGAGHTGLGTGIEAEAIHFW